MQKKQADVTSEISLIRFYMTWKMLVVIFYAAFISFLSFFYIYIYKGNFRSHVCDILEEDLKKKYLCFLFILYIFILFRKLNIVFNNFYSSYLFRIFLLFFLYLQVF
jgi:hypothetical protein